ncbi:hypothetical protein C8035_v007377 [Colletotrichum spinosum]|uniref:RGS domain-containing protein n=1 Tax=Colletotrichum spinosum TaxID=1347390 RepID=A0A4R8QER5_9PEZI|nr:hypothetical protein C8035_v007377 [Colletotrichum spinosum]
MDAERYRKAYEQIITNHEWIGDGYDHVCSLWEKLMQAYIIPYSPREVNLPSPVRDRLIAQSCSSSPPSPSELDEAVKIVYELMNDSVLLPFIDGATSRSASASAEHTEREGTTDDGGSAASPGTEPMTPPTTPPTSDWTFSTSPGGFQRALVAHKDGWKKVGAKLGLHRKSRSNRRNNPPSSAPTVGADMTMLDASTSQNRAL